MPTLSILIVMFDIITMIKEGAQSEVREPGGVWIKKLGLCMYY
jgi:hypothetical protein